MIKTIFVTASALVAALALFTFISGQMPRFQQDFNRKLNNCTDAQFIEENIRSGQEFTDVCARGLIDMQTNIENDAIKSVLSPFGYLVKHVKEIPTAIRNAIGGKKGEEP